MTARRGWLSGAILLVTVAAYLANGRTLGAGDTLPAATLPVSLIRERNLDLDEFAFLHDDGARRTYPLLDGLPYFLRLRGGHLVSAYTPGPGIMAIPFYLVPVLMGVPATPAVILGLEKLSASLLTALSVLVLFWALRRLTTPGWAVAVTAVYALGTSSLSVSSQGLWQHGPSQLCLSALIYLLVRGEQDSRWLPWTGLAMASAVAMRSTDLVVVLPVAGWLAWRHPRRLPSAILLALPPAVLLVAYNMVHFGSLGGGWGATTVPTRALFSQTPLLEGVTGILASPARGLFVYSPVLLLAVPGLMWIWRRGPEPLRPLTLGALLVIPVVGKWFLWWGGHSWGPRLLADTAPIWSLCLYPLERPVKRFRFVRILFVVLAALSIAIHALGAFLYDGRWDALVPADRAETALWSWRDGPLVFYARQAGGMVGRFVARRITREPTSADSPRLLAAAYRDVSTAGEATAGQPLRVNLTVINTGEATWLSSAPDERGEVRLGWKWYAGNVEIGNGRDYLRSDVLPGESVRFTTAVPAPATPGQYTLAVDLVSEKVTWFARGGNEPVRLPVRVSVPDGRQLISRIEGTPAWGPSVAIATDRRSYRQAQPLRLSVTLRNTRRPRSYDAYLVLEDPAGGLTFFDGMTMASGASPPWPPWVRDLPLPAEAHAALEPPGSTRSPGLHRWYAVLTEPGSHRAVARAETTFTVEP